MRYMIEQTKTNQESNSHKCKCNHLYFADNANQIKPKSKQRIVESSIKL